MAKGIATIELFDKKGNLVKQTKKRNFISNGVLTTMFQYKMIDVFLKNGYPEELGAPSDQISNCLGNPFERMWLTDASHNEDPTNEWLVKGKKAGWAVTSGASSTDLQSGLLNLQESFINKDQLHFVFDFATDRANGTFQSIYFTPIISYNLEGDSYLRVFPDITVSPVKVVKYNTKYYIIDIDDFLHVYTSDYVYEGATDLNLGFGFDGFDIYDGYIYYLFGNDIERAPLDDPANSTTFASNIGVEGEDICYDTLEQKWYIASEGDDTPEGNATFVITSFDQDFNILGVEVEADWEESYMGQYSLNKVEDGFFYGEKWAHSANIYNLLQNNNTIVGVDENYIYLNNLTVRPRVMIGSRVLLDDPVTKTDAYTMKVTYDFLLGTDGIL